MNIYKESLSPGLIFWYDLANGKRDLRFGTWNIRSMYRACSLTVAVAVTRELAEYKLDLVGVQEVRWDKGGTVRAGDYSYCYWYS
jgi:exonuclease III